MPTSQIAATDQRGQAICCLGVCCMMLMMFYDDHGKRMRYQSRFHVKNQRLASLQGAQPDVTGRGQAAYEVRVYSLAPGGGFGSVLGRRPVRAAHCLTSIQFSPTGQLLLLAYGR